jgi:sugar phosphate isomerase/epimerase
MRWKRMGNKGVVADMGIALQLYTVRDAAAADLAGTLKRVRDIGFEYVQWSGMPNRSAEEISAALEAAGLRAVSGHCDLESFERDFDTAVKFWRTIVMNSVAVGGMMGDCRDTLEGWLRGAKRLDAVGARLRSVGMRIAYHNHAFEFEKFPGDDRAKLDILYQETNPAHLYAEFDTAWVYMGGADPAAYLRTYAGRCPIIHVKDVAALRDDGAVRFMPLGEGVLDWPEIFKAGRAAGVEWYVYEQDTCEGDVFDCVRISYEFLRSHGAHKG